jgi:signal transduction histidine kinase
MALAADSQQNFAEHFARLLTDLNNTCRQAVVQTPPNQTPPQVTKDNSLNALAEMAGGAAHELNNPLSVIAGRAQLLANAETDPQKKNALKQIQDNAGEIAVIIDDLMVFAKPPVPRPASTGIKQVLDETVQLTCQKANIEHINVQIELADSEQNLFVDSAQIVSALTYVICNALESYEDQMGPIKITAEPDQADDFLTIQVADLGAGMDAETLKKATQPFFSGQPAGRKRGMGLAHAQRLIELNNGSLAITSELGKGTTVTISLPREKQTITE